MNNYFKVGPERNGPDSNEITVINKILKSPRILQKMKFSDHQPKKNPTMTHSSRPCLTMTPSFLRQDSKTIKQIYIYEVISLKTDMTKACLLPSLVNKDCEIGFQGLK